MSAITLEPKTGCAECEYTGFQMISVHGVQRAARCGCFRAKFLTAPGVPLEFKDSTLSNFIERSGNEEAVAIAHAWQKRTEGDLYLQGGVGAGKTRLATALLNEHFQQQRSGLFVRTARLMLDLMMTFRDQATDEERRSATTSLQKIQDVSLLVLDDFGVEKGSDFTRRTLYTVYEARHDQGFRTIWTSNYNLDWVQDPNGFSDARLASRIAGRAAIAQIDCGDWRVPELREARG